MTFRKHVVVLVLITSLLFPVLAFAEDDLEVSVVHSETCGEASLEIHVQGGTGPFEVLVDYGDEEGDEFEDVSTIPLVINHTYPSQGEFEYSIKVYDNDGMEGEAEGDITIAGPQVALESDPSPPLLPFVPGGVTVGFTALVSGGEAPYVFEWDLDADGNLDSVVDPTSNTASFTYTEPGKVKASVRATDACGFSDRDKLTVFIVDPSEEDVEEGEEPETEEESDVEKGCHPVAERIADVLNTLSPERIEGVYSCEDIFNFFQSEEGNDGHRFGLLQRAYQMTQIIDELTWEDILDWHLEGSGWGVLQQLNKFAGALEEVGVADLVDKVLNSENTVGEIRNAVRAVMRFDADFEDTLDRLEAGVSSGELNQFYRLASDMEVDPLELDEFLEAGLSLSEIKHASKLVGQVEGDWQEILQAYDSGFSWGEIRKASRLVDENTDLESLLSDGLDVYRDQQREERRVEREIEQNQRTAERLAQKYGVDEEDILATYHGICEGSWGCVQDQLRDQVQDDRGLDKDQRTATQISKKYEVDEGVVWRVYNGVCEGDWGCVRAHFRDLAKEGRGKEKD